MTTERDNGHKCFLALGSNLGDRLAHLTAAVIGLAADPSIEVLRGSGIYETAPVGGPSGQEPYLNAVIEVRTSLSPEALLQLCHRIEAELGRQRSSPNSPRTIDIDLLLCGQHVCNTDALILPHPRMHMRRFVLEPLAEIASEAPHPVLGETVRSLLAALEPARSSGQTCVRVSDWTCSAFRLQS